MVILPPPRFRGPLFLPPTARRSSAGFTLVEIMIAIGIVAMVMAWGVPSVFRVLKKDSMRQAVSDVMEACSHARARAILQGVPMELVIRADDGLLTVQPAPQREEASAAADPQPVAGEPTVDVPSKPFDAHLPNNIGVELLDVNFRDMMQADEARVRFFPNGTCDEFTIVLRSDTGGVRKISLEIVTSLAEMEVIR